MPFPMRVSVVVLAAVVACPAVPDAAQQMNAADANDFLMFCHTIACDGMPGCASDAVPDYGQVFGGLYATSFERHRAEVARGESLFRQALSANDPKRYPYLDRAALTGLETVFAELAKPPQETGSAPPAAQMAVTCDRLLTFLKQN